MQPQLVLQWNLFIVICRSSSFSYSFTFIHAGSPFFLRVTAAFCSESVRSPSSPSVIPHRHVLHSSTCSSSSSYSSVPPSSYYYYYYYSHSNVESNAVAGDLFIPWIGFIHKPTMITRKTKPTTTRISCSCCSSPARVGRKKKQFY